MITKKEAIKLFEITLHRYSILAQMDIAARITREEVEHLRIILAALMRDEDD